MIVDQTVNAFCAIRPSGIHGQGLFACRRIRKGTRILEYRGIYLDKETSNARGLEQFDISQQTGGGSVYIFELNDCWDIDGNVSWNPLRFANHSCAPNCEVVNEDDRLWLFALQDIAPTKELLFNYGYDIEHFLDHPCRCGSSRCVGYIVREDQWDKLRKRLKRKKR